MTKKDLFRLIIKLFGLYWLINTLFSLSQIIYFANNPSSDWTGVLYSLIVIIVAIVLFGLLIFKSDILIKWLKLDQGFDDDRIEFHNFNGINILKLAIILIGGMLIIDNLGTFLNQFYLALKIHFSETNNDIYMYNGYSTYYLFLSLTKIILGYLLLIRFSVVSKLLFKITEPKE